MILPIGDVETRAGHDAEAITSEFIDAQIRFFQACSRRENGRVNQVSKRSLIPEERNFNGRITEESYFVTTSFELAQCIYGIRFGLERAPYVIHPNLNCFGNSFGSRVYVHG